MIQFIFFITLLASLPVFAKECETTQQRQAQQFGLTIQKAVNDKNKDALADLFHGELYRGPRKSFLKTQKFDDIFPKQW
jgi:hypothetical protein